MEPGRTKEIVLSAIRHVHAFARDVDLTHEELMAGLFFATDIGQTCDDTRQEFILLSDLLGLSALVEQLDRKAVGAETPGSVIGPFHVQGAPFVPIGGSINIDHMPGGQTAYVHGQVSDTKGNPIAGAEIDIWQTAPNQQYAVQDDSQSEHNLRGRQLTDSNGRYGFITTKPVPYSVPRDGPCGKILDASRRHGQRAAHIHIGITADGMKPLVTELFPADDPYLKSDTVFGACDALLMTYRENTNPDIETELVAEFDFVLKRA